jgi:hypothetical protein
MSEYPAINSERIIKGKLFSDHLFVEWEEAPDEFAGTGLKRPDTFKPNHHTGLVLNAGPAVDPEILKSLKAQKRKKGVQPLRILFDRFSGVDGCQDPATGKRYAFIREGAQGSAYAIIPPRPDGSTVKITSGEGDFN